MLCVLCGVTPSSVLPPSKKSKKKKKNSQSGVDGFDPAFNPTTAVSYPTSVPLHSTPSSFKSSFDSLTSALLNRSTSKEVGFLQHLACHSCSSPVISCLFRVAAVAYGSPPSSPPPTTDLVNLSRTLPLSSAHYPKLQQSSPPHALTCAVIGMDDASTCLKIVYGLSGDPSGSLVLESLLEVCASPVYRRAWEGMDGRVKEYASDPVANHALQAAMRHCRDSGTAGEIVGQVAPLLRGLPPNRRGVAAAAASLAGRFEADCERVYNSLPGLFESLGLEVEEGGGCRVDVNAARMVRYVLEGFPEVWRKKAEEEIKKR